MTLYHSYNLPWTQVPEEFGRLKRNLIVAIALAVILGIVIPLLPVQKVDRTKAEALPPRLAQLMMEKNKPKPPPPPKKIEKKKPEKKKVKKKEKKKPKKKEKKKPKKKVVKKKPEKPKETAAQKAAKARKKASSVGLMAFADDLADLRDKPLKLALNKKLSKRGTSAKKFERNMLELDKVSESGGIGAPNFGESVGTTELEGRETTKLGESDIDKVAKRKSETVNRKDRKGKRTHEDVSLVMDRNKGAIYAIYGRALRRDPSLEGKFLIELTIAPSGQVVSIKIISSDLNAPKLEKKLLARIRLFNFGAKDVEEMIVSYPIDFLPP